MDNGSCLLIGFTSGLTIAVSISKTHPGSCRWLCRWQGGDQECHLYPPPSTMIMGHPMTPALAAGFSRVSLRTARETMILLLLILTSPLSGKALAINSNTACQEGSGINQMGSMGTKLFGQNEVPFAWRKKRIQHCLCRQGWRKEHRSRSQEKPGRNPKRRTPPEVLLPTGRLPRGQRRFEKP